MLHVRKTICIVIFLFLGLCSNAQTNFHWQAIQGAPVSWRLDDMHFLNPLEGWAVNPYYSYLTPVQRARVVHTSDGGQTWEILLDSSETFIRSVGFADSQTGWFGNLGELTPDTNFMYQTVDGGHSWSPVTTVAGPRPSGICGISVVTDSLTFAYGRHSGPSVILRTQDKGATWTSQSLDSLASGLVDAWFFGQDTGFIVGSYGIPRKSLVLGTTDGGDHWQVRHQGQREDEILWKVFFPSRLVGYAAVQSWIDRIGPAPDTTWILKTIDGGLTWQEKPVRTNAFYTLQGIGFINDQVGWVGGDCCNPLTFKTTNGGDTWSIATGFGVQTPPYNAYGGVVINRFRKFGDTLMYASGNTIYRMDTGVTVGGADALLEGGVMLYPNPTGGATKLKFKGAGQYGAAWEIFDCQGRRVHGPTWTQGADGEIELPQLPAGIYLYRCATDGIHVGSGRLLVNQMP
jgi:photosystem II stability/assembly factor-like uncharacterized protein